MIPVVKNLFLLLLLNVNNNNFFTLVISGALSPITQEFNLTTVQQELVVGAGTFGSIFGGFFAGLVSYLLLQLKVSLSKLFFLVVV